MGEWPPPSLPMIKRIKRTLVLLMPTANLNPTNRVDRCYEALSSFMRWCCEPIAWTSQLRWICFQVPSGSSIGPSSGLSNRSDVTVSLTCNGQREGNMGKTLLWKHSQTVKIISETGLVSIETSHYHQPP